MSWIPPDDLDPECAALCVALNALPGIETTESCCGHGETPFHVWFRVTGWDARGMRTLARCTCDRYYGTHARHWRVVLYHGDLPEDQASFLLESQGEPRLASSHAELLAASLQAHIEDRTVGYNILLDKAPDETTRANLLKAVGGGRGS